MRRNRTGILLGAVFPLLLVAQYGRHRGVYPGTAAPEARRDMVVTFQGKLKQMKKKSILIQTEDQLLTIRRSKTTKFTKDSEEIKATDIDLETPIAIDAKEDTDLKMIAVNVKVLPANASKPAETPAK